MPSRVQPLPSPDPALPSSCQASGRDGAPCRATPRAGRSWCANHDPDPQHRARMAEARAEGGRRAHGAPARGASNESAPHPMGEPGPPEPERALSDLKNRLAKLDTPELEAHRDTCLLARYLSEHTAEAAARVAAWTSRGAPRSQHAVQGFDPTLCHLAISSGFRPGPCSIDAHQSAGCLVGSLKNSMHPSIWWCTGTRWCWRRFGDEKRAVVKKGDELPTAVVLFDPPASQCAIAPRTHHAILDFHLAECFAETQENHSLRTEDIPSVLDQPACKAVKWNLCHEIGPGTPQPQLAAAKTWEIGFEGCKGSVDSFRRCRSEDVSHPQSRREPVQERLHTARVAGDIEIGEAGVVGEERPEQDDRCSHPGLRAFLARRRAASVSAAPPSSSKKGASSRRRIASLGGVGRRVNRPPGAVQTSVSGAVARGFATTRTPNAASRAAWTKAGGLDSRCRAQSSFRNRRTVSKAPGTVGSSSVTSQRSKISRFLE